MNEKISNLVQKLGVCQGVCNYCFNACLQEEDVKMMTRCIKMDKSCSEICGTTLSFVASSCGLTADILPVCIKACRACAEECEKHDYQHCQDCAKACKECAKACIEYLNELKVD